MTPINHLQELVSAAKNLYRPSQVHHLLQAVPEKSVRSRAPCPSNPEIGAWLCDLLPQQQETMSGTQKA
jgi:hypothetical protein